MRYLGHPLVLVVFTLLSALISLSLYSGLKRTRISTEQVDVLEQEINQIARDVSELEKEVQVASTSGAQEKIIRDELLMQKPGERVVQLPEVEASPVPRPSPSPTPTNWQQWRQILF
jgi:cell division protein FtsB